MAHTSVVVVLVDQRYLHDQHALAVEAVRAATKTLAAEQQGSTQAVSSLFSSSSSAAASAQPACVAHWLWLRSLWGSRCPSLPMPAYLEALTDHSIGSADDLEQAVSTSMHSTSVLALLEAEGLLKVVSHTWLFDSISAYSPRDMHAPKYA